MPEAKCGFNDSADGKTKGCDSLVTHGPTLAVDIGFDSKFNVGGGGVPAPIVTGIAALVDTGAFASFIDNDLAISLKLPIIDKQPVSGSNGKHMVNMYLAQIHVPSLQFTIYGSFGGVELAAGGQVHKALIGRTFLRKFTMMYSGSSGDVKIFR